MILGVGAASFWFLSQGDPGAAQGGAEAPPAQLVEASRATAPEETPTITQTGFVEPLRTVDVAFEVQGRIASVADAFEVGREMAAGTILARIDTERLDAALAQAEADLAAAEARAEEARAAFERQSTLGNRDVTAQAQVEDARAARDSAVAQVDVARAGVESARIDLRAAEVEAPFDGYVTARSASEGQIVSPGQAIGTLVRADVARVVVGLADRQVQAMGEPRALVGADVALRRTAGDRGRVRTGRIVDVDVRIDEAARTTNYLVDLPDPFLGAPTVRIGELLAVDIPLRIDAPLTAIPAAALKDGDAVWVVGEDGTLARRSVRVVHRTDETAFLADALDLRGTRVMTTDLAAPSDGMAVRVAGEDAAGAGASGSGQGGTPNSGSGAGPGMAAAAGAGAEGPSAPAGGPSGEGASGR